MNIDCLGSKANAAASGPPVASMPREVLLQYNDILKDFYAARPEKDPRPSLCGAHS